MVICWSYVELDALKDQIRLHIHSQHAEDHMM